MPVVIFTKHAKIRLQERSITLALVKKTLQEPDHITHAPETIVYSKKVGNQILTVVVIEKSQKLIVVTAYYEN